MKKYFFIMTFVLFSLPAAARHVAGGELLYEYLGPGITAGTSNYRITLRLFRDCHSLGPLLQNEPVTVGVYTNNVRFTTLPLRLQGSVSTISLNTKAFPCLVGNVEVCYEVALYTNTISLPDNPGGYTLSRSGCCRIDRISNLSQQLSVGSNYITTIPGTAALAAGQHNSSPEFRVKDTALVCANKNFTLDFGATDRDADSLSYSFCTGYASASGSNMAPPGNTLQLNPLPYAEPYSGTFPLGPNVFIDAQTGMILGIAPAQGQYVVSVCITEWRAGNPISEHRKDFILKVQDCDFVEARLPDRIIQCNDYTVLFENGSTSSAITSYRWDFGNPASPLNSSTDASPKHVYADTGRFVARLTVTGPDNCIGSDSTIVSVYPGFKAGFSITGNCFQNPYQFTDSTFARYGAVNSWRWNFGDTTTTADTSLLQHPSYKYQQGGFTVTAKLIVTSSKGCVDSLRKSMVIRDQPLISLPFKETLICSIDSLRMMVQGNGIFSWQPATNILFANTSSPVLFPKDTTKYFVTVNDNGCINTDSVTVNVLEYITVSLGADTSICRTDTFILHPVSDATTYLWAPANSLSNASVKNPVAMPLATTTYTVTANLGRCQATDQLLVKVAPYPQATVYTGDTAICYGNRFTLRASYTGTSFRWSPTGSLINAGQINPVAGPTRNTVYTLTARDSLSGCNKAVSDSVRVAVIPVISVDAGRDTSVVPDQLLQLNATASGGSRFLWSPALGLNNPAMLNPVLQLGADIDSARYLLRAYDPSGCYGEDEVLVTVFKTSPDIFVPSAFTPNGDGRNDVLKPLTVGISKLLYFRVYNRWGQLLFSTAETGRGWDGSYRGINQPSNTYVYLVQGTDHRGKPVFRKGTSVLIR